MVSGPEMARVIGEFEMSTEKKKSTDFCHHEETKVVIDWSFGVGIYGVTASHGDPINSDTKAPVTYKNTRVWTLGTCHLKNINVWFLFLEQFYSTTNTRKRSIISEAMDIWHLTLEDIKVRVLIHNANFFT